MITELTNIHHLSADPYFDMEECLSMVPLLIRITRNTKQQTHILNSRLSFIKKESPKAVELRQEINIQVSKWADKVRRLGGVPLSAFKVELAAPQGGRYVWEYPNKDISYFNQ